MGQQGRSTYRDAPLTPSEQQSFRDELLSGPDLSRESAPVRFAGGVARLSNPVPFARAFQANPPGALAQIATEPFGHAREAGRALMAGDLLRAAGHAGAAIPLVGPAAWAEVERVAETGDVAGAIGAGLALLGPVGVPRTRAAIRAGLARLPESLAERAETAATRQFVDVVAPKVGPKKSAFGMMAEHAAPRAQRDPAFANVYSRAGYELKANEGLRQAQMALDSAEDARLAARSFPAQPLIDRLEQQANALTARALEADLPTRRRVTRVSEIRDASGQPILVEEAGPPEPFGADQVSAANKPRVDAIRRAIKEVKGLGPLVSYEAIRTLRQAWDVLARAVYTADNPAKLTLEAQARGAADITAAMREYLSERETGGKAQTAQAYADYSFHRDLVDALKTTEQTERQRPTVGRRIGTALTGAAVGSTTGKPSVALSAALLAPVVDQLLTVGYTAMAKVAMGRWLRGFADAVRGGDVSRAMNMRQKLFRIAGIADVAAGAAGRPEGRQAVEEAR